MIWYMSLVLAGLGDKGNSGGGDVTAGARKTKGRGFLLAHEPEDRGQEDDQEYGRSSNGHASQGMHKQRILVL